MKQDRRNFLKKMGFWIAGTLLPACQAKVEKLVPFLTQPENYVPSKTMKYRTFFYNHSDFAEIIVSNIDNRPIKLEGNPDSKTYYGGLNARVQASLFDFYDSKRIKEPIVNGQNKSWDNIDEHVLALLEASKKKNKKVILVIPHLISPTEKKAIEDFKTYWQNISVHNLSTDGYENLAKANKKFTGSIGVPTFALQKAKSIVGFQCDFLGGWLDELKNTVQYSQSKKQFGNEFTHLQFESLMTITGSNATQRIQLRTAEINDLISGLHARCFDRKYKPYFKENNARIDEIIAHLENSKNQSLLLYGGEDEHIHRLVLELNKYFDNYGSTVFPYQKDLLFSNEEVDSYQQFFNVDAETIIFYKSNPFYYWSNDGDLVNKIRSIPNKIGIFDTENETSVECTIVAPSHHHFETWSDAQVEVGKYYLGQPVFNPVFNTRTAGEQLLRWTGNIISWKEYLENNWYKNIIPLASGNPEQTWKKIKQDGRLEIQINTDNIIPFEFSKRNYPDIIDEKGFELIFFPDIKLGSGEYRNNNCLHELADPVTKVCWDTYFTIHPLDLEQLAWDKKEAVYPIIEVYFNNRSLKAPAIPVDGQARKTLGFAFGKGTVNEPSETNAFPIIFSKGRWKKNWNVDQIKLTGEVAEIGIIHKTTKLPEGYLTEISQDDILKKADTESLYEKWQMLIDVDLCTGCSSCVVACRVENNIPLVGKKEILKNRDIDWIKIERFQLENNQILHLPLMCQHCDNAPCENVCPVFATTQSSDGLNQMVYNRCVGTRYCAVNCVYNVRRFNWSNYWQPPYQNLNLGNANFSALKLNPKVTVRTKGIMEKCNFCQHRIQEERENAKLEGRKMLAENASPACASSCPAKAVQLINLNSKVGVEKIAGLDKSLYHLLAKYNTEPSVIYLSNRLNA